MSTQSDYPEFNWECANKLYRQSTNPHKLPAPRIEMMWVDNNTQDYFRSACIYSLVLPVDEYDIRSNTADEYGVFSEIRTIIDITRSSSSSLTETWRGLLTLRTWKHMAMDLESMKDGIPVFMVNGETVKDVTEEAKMTAAQLASLKEKLTQK